MKSGVNFCLATPIGRFRFIFSLYHKAVFTVNPPCRVKLREKAAKNTDERKNHFVGIFMLQEMAGHRDRRFIAFRYEQNGR